MLKAFPWSHCCLKEVWLALNSTCLFTFPSRTVTLHYWHTCFNNHKRQSSMVKSFLKTWFLLFFNPTQQIQTATEDLLIQEIIWVYQLWPFCQRFSFWLHQWDGKQTCMNKNQTILLLQMKDDWIRFDSQIAGIKRICWSGVHAELRCVHCHRKQRKPELSKQTSWSTKIRRGEERAED